ncbi:hypothetical protein BLOT_002041 [Blomia tropicalis]|nr:hypothetical protein BLOT_002041 [Blomia tropicalis]
MIFRLHKDRILKDKFSLYSSTWYNGISLPSSYIVSCGSIRFNAIKLIQPSDSVDSLFSKILFFLSSKLLAPLRFRRISNNSSGVAKAISVIRRCGTMKFE